MHHLFNYYLAGNALFMERHFDSLGFCTAFKNFCAYPCTPVLCMFWHTRLFRMDLFELFEIMDMLS